MKTSNEILNLIPTPPAIEILAEEFNPVIHKVDQIDALEQVALLREQNFTNVGQTELHSGVHPVYGRCIIMISDASASIIPFA
ncbi:hypothetical protein ABID82_005100 [Methylobacterium sp. PvP062]|uniref:Uncharacterized protein n=1 Tax=Methylobacterium radiotolerans TaxID=31998 RepID=A0ABV2NUH8_9HYPH|nr:MULTISPECIES: hypothetical protein [unclassified Methylobacterium]MBP2498414.1 hypothetical protein [Methylobacterium sp. PvP105]MBP2505593.1 hypothetical protein [Methylobacterium sp. PvP109]